MSKLALYVHLESKPGKEEEVAKFLEGALPIVRQEPATIAWFAIRMGPSTFGIFDAFPDEAGRQAHLSGQVAEALMAKAGELLAQPPKIQKIDVLAEKLPSPGPGTQTRHRGSAQNGDPLEIPIQVGSEVRIRNTGEVVVDNPETELAQDRTAADAVLAYTFNRNANEHVLRLLEPVADHEHMRKHRRND